MAKWGKKLLGLAAVGTALAGALYYFKKNQDTENDAFEDDFEDEDFDLDEDLKPAGDREYVPLKPSDSEDSKTPEQEETEETFASETEAVAEEEDEAPTEA